MKREQVTLRRLRNAESDYRLLTTWCAQESVYRYFEQRVLKAEEIRAKYYPRTLEDAKVSVYLIEWENRPVGMIQYQKVDAERAGLCGIGTENGYEMDLFIGEEACRGQGIGQAAVCLMAKKLFAEEQAEVLLMCPLKENIRAIRCYEKCGFKQSGCIRESDTIGVMQEYAVMQKKKGS